MTALFSQARWIWTTDEGNPRYAVRRFRARLLLGKPETIFCHISADSRYILYVDGNLTGRGPLRSDVRHQVYETFELKLEPGEHVFAVIVLAYSGSIAPVSEMHDRGALILEARTKAGTVVLATSSGTWRVQADTAYSPRSLHHAVPHYFAVGAAEHVVGANIPDGWKEAGFDDSHWEVPTVLTDGYLFGRSPDLADPGGRWRLVPRTLPSMKYEPRSFVEDSSFPVTISANESRDIILDAGEYATGFPLIEVEGGVGSTVTLLYAEAFTRNGKKGIRDDRSKGTDLTGYSDVYEPSGRIDSYEPLQWRAFRYIKLSVKTGNEPLTIRRASYHMTGYPWKKRSSFEVVGGPPQVQEIQSVDFRTLERCTADTFMDGPYFEQLQYVGDTRIQALMSYITTGDTRLGERAVKLFFLSRLPEGLTQSRYPNRNEQIMPPYSLIWIMMVEDLLRYDPNGHAIVADSLLGCRGVLEWFGRQLTPEGVLGGNIPHWNFIDWTDAWLPTSGVPPVILHGMPCATLNLQYLTALRCYVRLRLALGDHRESEFWEAEADMLADAITETFWNKERQIFREGPDWTWGYTQHAQAWALLAGIVPEESIDAVVRALHEDEDLVPTTYYHSFYIVEALAKVGRLEKLWSKWLKPWQEALKLHVTTWPEKAEPSQSDCHAWTAWPTYAFLKHVLGVRPGTAGFAKTTIAPLHIDGWDIVEGAVPTPAGLLKVKVDWTAPNPPQITSETIKSK